MISIDGDALESLVWYYSEREGIIQPETWEKIICQSTKDGEWIGGDTYMADGKTLYCGLNIKSILKKFTKGNIQTISVIQCRCPLDENIDVGKGTIDTLTEKKNESLKKFNLKSMVDIDIIHYRDENNYNYRVFVTEHPDYDKEEYIWKDNAAYMVGNKKWKIKRNDANSSAFQTCVLIKKCYDVKTCAFKGTIKSNNNYSISTEDVKKLYEQSKVQ